MRTSFRQRNKFPYRAAAIFILGIILLAILGVTSDGFRSRGRDLFIPVLSISSKIRNLLEDFGGNKISELESRNAELIGENTLLEERISELESGVANSGGAQNFVKSSSLVLSQAPSTPYDTLLISLAATGAARIGTKVNAHGGIYIGQISETGEKAAMVKLLSFPAQETEAWLEREKINITLVGEGGYNLKFLIPKEVSVEVGDKVLSNTNPQFLIGEVSGINEKPTDPLKAVHLRFPFNFRNLRYVELID